MTRQPSRLQSFYLELKRRRVIRVALVYAIAGWSAVQVADTFFRALQLPDWTVSFVAALTLIGFPVAIVLAWAFEITPQGVRRTRATRGHPGHGSHKAPAVPAPVGGSRALGYVGVGVLLALVGFGAYARFWPRAENVSSDDGRIESIAVLPFVNMSPDPEQEYFSDGLAEELLNALAQIPGLRVAARTSSFAFKGTNADVREIGQKLDVAAVLEGSVRRSGSRVRVTAQLVGTANGYHLWSDEYDRELADLLAMQDDISRAITNALKLKLSGGAPSLAERGTGSARAHDLYLRGLYQLNRRRAESLRLAVQHFEEAIAADPAYGRAYAGLSQAWAVLPQYDRTVPIRDALEKGKPAAEKALELDPALAEAHAALGQIAQEYEWQWDAAEQHYREAIALNPNYATAYQWLAEVNWFRRRFDESLAAANRALELDPLSLIINHILGFTYLVQERHDLAIEQFKKTLELDPTFASSQANLQRVLLAAGRYDEARAATRRLAEITGRDLALTLAIIDALQTPARRPEVLRALHAQLTSRPANNRLNADLAHAFMLLGDHDAALRILENVVAQHAVYAHYIAADPEWSVLRDDPRFRALLRKMNLE